MTVFHTCCALILPSYIEAGETSSTEGSCAAVSSFSTSEDMLSAESLSCVEGVTTFPSEGEAARLSNLPSFSSRSRASMRSDKEDKVRSDSGRTILVSAISNDSLWLVDVLSSFIKSPKTSSIRASLSGPNHSSST